MRQICDVSHAVTPETSERKSKANNYGADLAPCGPVFFTFSTSVFANSIALGSTKLFKLLVGSGNPWSCTIAGVRLKYFKIDIDIFQHNSANKFYHVTLPLTG